MPAVEARPHGWVCQGVFGPISCIFTRDLENWILRKKGCPKETN
jgi:hypothetical protein